ncbi:MAG: GH92 family glycosyl hydrolase [Acidobacteriota bacterium]
MKFLSASLRRSTLFLLLTAHGLLLTATAQNKDYTRWVNPFIGTGGHGHTFPGATMPFGMVQLSPDTRTDNWDGSSGYHYSDDIIYGFSHTHLSGTGIPDGCDILFMPTVGEPQFFAKEGEKSVNGYASKFSHANEKAEAGYYSVKLDDDGILAEMTATKRVGMHRYTFPADSDAKITLDLTWRDKTLMSQIDVKGDRIEGWRRSSSWAKDQTIYFVAQFSERFAAPYWYEEYTYPTPHITKDQAWIDRSLGEHIRVAFPFSKPKNRRILLKVAISSVSIEGARKNLEAELPGWDFDKVRADAKAAWNKELSKIEVSGGTDEQTINFYTALYHTMIQPNVFNDVDGQYKGHDGKIHQLRTGDSPVRAPSEQYTVFSLWDTFRAAHPLYTIIDQKRTVDFINTFIRIYEQGGRLPVWELWGEETDTMIGYHAVSVIADAMAKGIKGFDYEKAYAAAKHSAELDHFGLAAYKKRGYISMEDENESVSKTLEYAYNDWCISQMAALLLKERYDQLTKMHPGALLIANTRPVGPLYDVYKYYSQRARYFENLFDPKTGFMRPKKNGGFIEPFAPNEVTFGFTEGNSWQYSFFVPQDVTRLMELMGGREKFVAKLDELFTTDQKLAGREQADLTGLIGQYAHGNEPSHHIAYLYNYAGQPWKTQKYVRYIMDNFYKNAPDGLIGNEDCGQMSAWYVMSAGGFYPVSPGEGVYAFGTPLFPEMTYRLENGKKFTIRAKNVSPKNIYVLDAKFNGAPYKKAFITHDDIVRGGLLELAMTDQPVTTAFNEFPVSGSSRVQASVPVIEGVRTFDGETTVSMRTTTKDAMIFYTVDGSTPTRSSKIYFQPFTLAANTTVRAFAYFAPGNESPPVEASFRKRPNDWTVKVLSGYSTQYTGGGDNAIVDGIRGTVNFASGEWQGIQGKPYEAIIDLKRETEIKELGGSFLQVAGPWIWIPDRIEFEISTDGTNYTKAAEIKPNFPQREMTPTVKEFTQTISPTRARYVRIRAYNFGKIPAWHPGAGGDPWVFIDEIFID